MGMVLMILGILIAIVGGIWFLVVAFQESILWGLGCIFVPFVSLVFLVMHWQVAKKPFLIQMLGTALMIVGIIMSPEQSQDFMNPS